MNETTNVLHLRQPDTIDDPLTDILRAGARKLLAQAIEIEAGAFLASMRELKLPDGRDRLVRHGHGPERTIQTGIGPVEVSRVKIRDRGASSDEDRIRFSSAILPKWARRTRSGIVRLALVRAYGRVSGMSTTSNPYRGFRFPAEIINQAVWLYHCFSLSLREVELILAARGIVVSYETIRGWSLRFGRTYAKTLKRRRPKSGDKWFLDEVFVRIQGKLHYLWRAVDQYGNVLDVLVQSRRNTKAAKRFFRKLLKGLCYVPRVIVTDKLGSYGAAKREILPGVEHRQSRYLNNRCEVSHQPTRRRERHMRRFKSARQAQQFLSIHTPIHNHFQLRRHRLSASEYRAARDRAFATWREATGTALV